MARFAQDHVPHVGARGSSCPLQAQNRRVQMVEFVAEVAWTPERTKLKVQNGEAM